MSLLLDTPTQERHAQANRLFTTRQITAQAIADQKREVARTLPVDGFDPRNTMHQLGKAMSSTDLTAKLRGINSTFVFVDSPDQSAINVMVISKQKNLTGGEDKKLRQVSSYKKGWMPEYSILHPVYETAYTETRDEVQTLKTVRETRGWRTVVVALLKEKLITGRQIIDTFYPQYNRFSWNEQTKGYGL